MTTFEDAKIGDQPWSVEFGWGEVVSRDTRSKCLTVEFNGEFETYCFKGTRKRPLREKMQTLFWDEVVIDAPVKPKTHIVNGVEVPDLRIEPKMGERYWYPTPASLLLCAQQVFRGNEFDFHRKENKLCYEDSVSGEQAAILHAKAWMGSDV